MNALAERIIRNCAIVVIALGLSSCGVAQVAVEKMRESDPGDVSVTKMPSYDTAKVTNYQRVVVLTSEAGANGGGTNIFGAMPNMSGLAATGGGSADIFSGRLTTELSRLGYEVLERADIERVATPQQLEQGTERVAIELARKVGADALLVSVAQQGTSTKFGMFGVGAGFETGIVSTSIKLIDVENQRSQAIISSDYPEPRTATEAVDGLVPFIAEAFGREKTTNQS